MKRLLTATLLLTATVAFAKNPASESKFSVKETDHKGTPSFVTGDLGKLTGNSDKAAKDFLKSQKQLLKLNGVEDFDTKSSLKDAKGQTHTKFQETLHGLPVIGAEYIVHTDASGNVIGMNGRIISADDDPGRNPKVDAVLATDKAAKQNGIMNGRFIESPTLTYVVNEKSALFLAWTTRVEYVDARGPQIDRIYADAMSGDLVLVAPEYKYAKNRITYSANNGTALPGTQKRTETSANIGDAAIDAAHNYAGNVYDYYKNVHGRDSYDNAGATIKSSAHYSTSYNNAFWNGTQMVYGDGDGSQFTALSKALDVDAHELTHAVTERTAGLTYSNESGALNEATSDILGNSCEAYSLNAGTPNANTWKVGEDITTPATAGDALRYMNNPTADGYSKDYYPEKITGTADNGGVHGNSGIANLAYYLMVMGGTHPRSKTTVVVPALSATSSTSLDMASKIWYRALTVYFTSSTNFQSARNGTAQAAADLYGGTAGAAYNSVQKAWDAVGAPGGVVTPPSTTVLSNNVTVTGISGATGSWTNYKITVPASQTQLKITMSGGTGDADMYVKRGAVPTSSVWDYRPYVSGNAETVTVANPVAGDWYISLNGYAAFSGVSLNATYTGTAPPPTCTNYTGTLSGTGATAYAPTSSGYVSSVSGSHVGKLTGTGTDFDLYLEKLSGTTWSQVAASEGSTATENITYAGTAGTFRFRIYAYSGGGNYTLCISHP
ncbi:MAG: Zinc metalloproteinase precursor/aureolysin [Acidobacteria bacterium]|nr:Zinc metalloproteinase precursor/aureolysin [Acidobacteriota bacterium]